MNSSLIPLAVLLVISGIALADGGDAPKDQPAKFKITTRRADDAVEVRADKGRRVFAVRSPSGSARRSSSGSRRSGWRPWCCGCT
jgi:hypothetical protein